VKKEKIKKIWPLFPAPDPLGDDIRKFEHYGTQSDALFCAVSEALSFHNGIGTKNKEERLRYLRDYWISALRGLPGVKILTPLSPELSCGIGTFSVENMDMEKLVKILFDHHKILLTPISLPEKIHGIRVTPSIYTRLQELDTFIEAVSFYIKNGLPDSN
jgi:selenocysteine lyase/cysteine desulfurase